MRVVPVGFYRVVGWATPLALLMFARGHQPRHRQHARSSARTSTHAEARRTRGQPAMVDLVRSVSPRID
jgi:hypothetical protein